MAFVMQIELREKSGLVGCFCCGFFVVFFVLFKSHRYIVPKHIAIPSYTYRPYYIVIHEHVIAHCNSTISANTTMHCNGKLSLQRVFACLCRQMVHPASPSISTGAYGSQHVLCVMTRAVQPSP